MKLALRYGLLIAAGIMAWTIIAHTLIPDPKSIVHSLGAFTFFNLLHFVGIYLGLRALERQNNEKPTFKEGMKQGVSISFVYAVTAALFFAGVLLVIGTKWMAAEAATPDVPMWVVALQAFAGLTVMSMLFGVAYSAVISFFLAKRLTQEN